MSAIKGPSVINIPVALKLVGIVGGAWGILVVLGAALVYRPSHPEFSLLTTYLSDMGADGGWPQVVFNAGTLIAAPIRYLVVVLLGLRLMQLGAGRGFVAAMTVIGFISSVGSAWMAAVPHSFSPTAHEMGIPLYFLGVVVLQTVIGLREWSFRRIPRILPILSFLIVAVFVVFATLMVLYERGAVSRATPVIWEWLAVSSSIVWLFAHSILLGRSPAGGD
jgi:hypothetical membrane protein